MVKSAFAIFGRRGRHVGMRAESSSQGRHNLALLQYLNCKRRKTPIHSSSLWPGLGLIAAVTQESSKLKK